MFPKSRLAITVALATAAVSAPTAAAMAAEPVTTTDARGEYSASRGEHAASLSQTAPAFDLRSADAREPDGGPVSTQPVVIEVPEPAASGFDWTDAGIGAAGGLALTVLFGSGVVLARRRVPRPTVG
jgi:hypothetical protein